MLCFPSGERLSVRACCTAKAAFRQHLNRLAAEAPSRTGAVHRWVMPVKIFFLLLLLGIGRQAVVCRVQTAHKAAPCCCLSASRARERAPSPRSL